MLVQITEARKGDIVRFKSYALRIEAEPRREGSAVILSGRISIDGCPIVTKRFNSATLARIEKT